MLSKIRGVVAIHSDDPPQILHVHRDDRYNEVVELRRSNDAVSERGVAPHRLNALRCGVAHVPIRGEAATSFRDEVASIFHRSCRLM